MPARPVTILGGLPVLAEVSFSYDAFTMEHDAEVDGIYWLKRDGTAGAHVSQKIWDRVERETWGLCGVIEQVSEQLAYESWRERELEAGRDPDRQQFGDDMVSFD